MFLISKISIQIPYLVLNKEISKPKNFAKTNPCLEQKQPSKVGF
jgi:hypothetical protein